MLPYDNISAKKAERAELEENNIYEVTHFGDLVSMDLLATRTLALPWETWAKFYLVIRLPSRSVLPQTVCLARSYRETPRITPLLPDLHRKHSFCYTLWKGKSHKGLPLMMSTKSLGLLTPSPLVRIWN